MERIIRYIIYLLLISIIVISIILFVKDTKSSDDGNQYIVDNIIFKLKGTNSLNIYQNTKYVDDGYILNIDGNEIIDKYVGVVTDVNTNKVGKYKVSYTLSYQKHIVTIERNVNVIKPNITGENNTINLSLKGSNTVYVLKDTIYHEAGITASDTNDGNISNTLVIDGTVDNSTIGQYLLKYRVTNSMGVTREINRTIIVYDISVNINKSRLNNQEVITLVIGKEHYQKTLKPDNTYTTDSVITYTPSTNGMYSFVIYDLYGFSKTVSIDIDLIDIVKPIGNCTLTLYNTSSTINVNASDNIGVKGYQYIYGNNTTDLLNSNSYSYNELVNTSKVIIYDDANNNVTIECKVIDNSTKMTPGYTEEKYTIGNKRWDYLLYVPEGVSLRNKVPLVLSLHGGGECGNNLDLLKKEGLPKYIKNNVKHKFIMIAPQLDYNEEWVSSTYNYIPSLKKLVDYASNTYMINKNKIAVTGYSLGGIAAYTLGGVYPNYFSGLAPIAGRASSSYASNLATTNIWAFHGELDNSVSYINDVNLINAIVAKGGNAKLTTFYGMGHAITYKAYTEMPLIEWLIEQNLN